jgi:hypothetical protein
MNETEITTEVGRSTFRFWRAGLRAVLGWSDERISQWAAQWKEQLNNENSFLFHRTAVRILAPALIPDELERKIVPSGQYVDLICDLEVALNIADDFPDLDPNYDWQSARERVQKVLRKHGGNLP